MHTILFAKQCLLKLAQLAIVELERLVRGRSDTKLALVVKVEAGNVCSCRIGCKRFGGLEAVDCVRDAESGRNRGRHGEAILMVLSFPVRSEVVMVDVVLKAGGRRLW